MAGRGTDIKLGGDPDSFAAKVAEKGTDEYDEIYKVYQKDCEENREKVLKQEDFLYLEQKDMKADVLTIS